MDQFPCALYRMPGRDFETDLGWVQYATAADADALKAAKAEGWHETPQAAADALKAPHHVADNAPPTRAELEQKATELGIAFDGRWGDKKLSAVIADKLKG